MKKKRNCKGSMTVEAVFALPIFIFAFMAFLIVTKYIYLQVVMQNAINQTAKEIAQYSYIISKISATEVLTKGEDKESAEFIGSTNDYMDGVMDFFEVMESEKSELEGNLDITATLDDIETAMKNLDDLDTVQGSLGNIEERVDGVKSSYENITKATNELMSKTEDYFEKPEELLAGLVSVLKGGAIDVLKSRVIAAPASRALCKKYLPCPKENADTYLKLCGIKDGIKGLNFNLSTLFEDGKSVNIVVVYTISQELPLFGTMEIDCKLTASTAGWLN